MGGAPLRRTCYSARTVTTWDTIPAPLPPSSWAFPPLDSWPDDDLVAAGAELDPSTLVDAYRVGLFPMIVEIPQRVIGWWSPNPRGILPLDGLKVSDSLRRSAKRFDIRSDTCFADVIRGCADPARKHGWISKEFVDAYTALHRLGWAHSIEVFDRSGTLAGGLYGVRIGKMFAGESMFSRQRDASKVALMGLVDRMRRSDMTLLDVQWCTDHLASLGAIAIPREEYLARLAEAVAGYGS
jgi:leucyl/phenylalanyl-tRNA--protein transferase